MKTKTLWVVRKALLVLAVLGFLVSIYMTFHHYDPQIGGGVCDINSTVSCSSVNTSIFSELFGIPVAIFGALWFIVVFALAWRLPKGVRKEETWFLIWSILGFIFIIYMIIAEIILRQICSFCTVVHVLVLIILVLVWKIYRR